MQAWPVELVAKLKLLPLFLTRVDAGRITMTMTCRGSKSLIEND
jgi:hypothetical protein